MSIEITIAMSIIGGFVALYTLLYARDKRRDTLNERLTEIEKSLAILVENTNDFTEVRDMTRDLQKDVKAQWMKIDEIKETLLTNGIK